MTFLVYHLFYSLALLSIHHHGSNLITLPLNSIILPLHQLCQGILSICKRRKILSKFSYIKNPYFKYHELFFLWHLYFLTLLFSVFSVPHRVSNFITLLLNSIILPLHQLYRGKKNVTRKNIPNLFNNFFQLNFSDIGLFPTSSPTGLRPANLELSTGFDARYGRERPVGGRLENAAGNGTPSRPFVWSSIIFSNVPFKLHFCTVCVFSHESANWYARGVDKSALIPLELRNLVHIWNDMQKKKNRWTFFLGGVFSFWLSSVT